MTPFKRNLSKLLFFALVVAIGTVVSGVIYYLKMGQNEDTLNTLLFRELQQVEGTITRSLEKIQVTTNYLLSDPQQDIQPPALQEDYRSDIEAAVDKLSQADDLDDITLIEFAQHEGGTWPYFSERHFTFSIPTFNTARIVNKRHYQDAGSVVSITLETSIHHSLKQRIHRFQTVALVDEQGVVKSVVTHASGFNNETELYIKQLVNFHNQQPRNTTDHFDVHGTRFVDARLSGSDLRFYIHPIMDKGLSADSTEYYLVGLIAKSEIITQKLKLSPTLLMWLILGLLLLIAIIPLIKLRFVNSTYAIQQSDKSQIMLGLLLAVGILTIGFTQELFFDYFKEVKQKQLRHLHASMSRDFKDELTALLPKIQSVSTLIDQQRNSTKNEQASPADNRSGAASEVTSTPYYTNLIDKAVLSRSLSVPTSLGIGADFIESAFHFNQKGEADRASPFIVSSSQLAVQQEIDVTARKYVTAAQARDFWLYSETGKPFFIERIFNIEDGRRNAMVSMPASVNHAGSATFVAAGTRFESLVDRVLPNNFGYAVINQQGAVQFHSDDSLSLIENFFTEANRNPELMVASEHTNVTGLVTMDVIYKGDPHTLAVGPLLPFEANDGQRGIPWQLIVFYNPEALQTNNMIMVFLAVFLYMLVIIPSFLLLRYMTYQRFWQELCGFDMARTHCYARYSVLVFASCLAVQFQLGVLQSLSSRLLIWAVVCALLAMFMITRFRIRLSYYNRIHQPLTAFWLIVGVAFLVFGVYFQLTFNDVIALNNYFSIAGVIVLAAAYCLLYSRTFHHLLAFRHAFFRRTIPFIAMTRKPSLKDHEASRFTAGYVIFLTSLIYLGAAVPAGLIAHSAHEYLLQRQAHYEENNAAQFIQTRRHNYEDYLLTIFGESVLTQSSTAASDLPGKLNAPRLDQVIVDFFPEALICPAGPRQDDCWVRISMEEPSSPAHGTTTTNSPAAISINTNSTDDIFDALFSIMYSNTELVSHLTYAAKRDISAAQGDSGYAIRTPTLRYRADTLMFDAIKQGSGLFMMLLSLLALPLAIYLVVRKMIVQRMMGEHLHDQYRVLQRCAATRQHPQPFPDLEVEACVNRGHSQLILNATRLEAEKQLLATYSGLFNGKVHRITDCLDQHYSLDEHAREYQFISDLKITLKQPKDSTVIVGISAVEQISLDHEERKKALELLYELHLMPRVLLVVISETAPLYRLLNPASYETLAETPEPDIDEKSAWSKLFSEFEKHYAWSPICKSRIENPFNIAMLIEHECNGWPEMQSLKKKLITATRAASHSCHQTTDTESANHDYQYYWQPEQVIEFMLMHAGPLYRRKWEECTTREKLILWKVAHGASVNPASAATIEHLVRRCYLFRDKGWHLVNESFRQFILTAESEAVIHQWIDNTSTGAWSILRIPIFALLLVLLVMFIYSSGSSLNTILSIATATLGLIPLLIKNFSLLKAGSGTELE